MIPLPRKMSKTPDQVEEFNVYAYVKQLIDGNDVSVLLLSLIHILFNRMQRESSRNRELFVL